MPSGDIFCVRPPPMASGPLPSSSPPYSPTSLPHRDCPCERDLSLIASRLCGLTGALRTDHGNDQQGKRLDGTSAITRSG
jgi:hypothetical protein